MIDGSTDRASYYITNDSCLEYNLNQYLIKIESKTKGTSVVH